MALGIVRRWSWVTVAACFGLLQACSGSSSDDDDSSDGCAKDSDCREGRICENKTCVNDPTGGAVLGGTGGTGGTSSGSGGSANPGSGGTGNSAGGTTGGSSGSSGSGGTSGSSGTGGTSGTGGSAVCTVNDPSTCPTTESMTYCPNGQNITVTCSEFCSGLGFAPGTCTEPDGCDCDVNTMTDPACVDAMNVYCNCLDGSAQPCTNTYDPADPDSLIYYPPFIYATCHGGGAEDMSFLHCLVDQANMDPAPLCSDAFKACDPTQ